LNWTRNRQSGTLHAMEQTTQEISKSTPWWVPPKPVNLALLAGLMVTLGLPPITHTGLLVPLGLAVLFIALKDARQPAKLMWIFALVHQASLLHWLFLLIPAKTIPTRALVPIQASLAILYVTVFYLLLGWLFGTMRSRFGYRRALLAMPAMWVGMEALRARGEMAFPWCISGASVVDGPLMGLLRASGEIGMSALVVFTGMTLAFLWLWRSRGDGYRRAGAAALGGTFLLMIALVIGSQLRPAKYASVAGSLSTEPLKIAAIQADVSLEDKWQDSKIDSTRIPYRSLSLDAASEGAQFLIWAETAMPAYIRYEKLHLNWVREVVRQGGVPLYTGFPDAERLEDGGINKYNSSGLFAADGSILDRYAKHHLLPIGEAMPFTSLFPSLAKINVGQAEWTPGLPPEALHLPTESGDFPFSGLICFESILAAQARDSVRRGSRCLVVLTNDGWFGETAGPRQHTKMALLRAAESSVPMVRCANNGISLICDENGLVLDELELGKRGFVMAELLPGSGRTAYVRWGAWPLFWLLMIWVGVVLFARPREK
jgi:apolipoprotein N-acyltransferase